MTQTFKFKATVWLYSGKAAWHFATLPAEIAKEIDDLFAHAKHGWGSLKVVATIGNTSWTTSIFPDKESESYLLPIKRDVRTAEAIKENDAVQVNLKIKD